MLQDTLIAAFLFNKLQETLVQTKLDRYEARVGDSIQAHPTVVSLHPSKKSVPRLFEFFSGWRLTVNFEDCVKKVSVLINLI